MNPKSWSWIVWMCIVVVMIATWATLGIVREIVEKQQFQKLSDEQWEREDREIEAKWRTLVDPTRPSRDLSFCKIDVPEGFIPYPDKIKNALDDYLAHPAELFAEWQKNQLILTSICDKMADLPSWRIQCFVLADNRSVISSRLEITCENYSTIPWDWALRHTPLHRLLCTGAAFKLHDLDRFWNDQWSPVSDIDYQAASLADRIRNQAYLDLERIGHLPAEQRQIWLHEHTDLTPAAIKFCQRLRIPKSVLQNYFYGFQFTSYPSLSVSANPLTKPMEFFGKICDTAGNIAGTWLFKPLLGSQWKDATQALRWSINTENALISNSNQCSNEPDWPWIRPYLVRGSMPFSLTYLISGPNAQATRFRLAVRVLADVHAGKSLPANHAEVISRYGEAACEVPKGPTQIYEKLSNRRFRIRSANTASVPWFTPPPNMQPTSSTSTGPSVFKLWYCDIEVLDPVSLPLTDPNAGSPTTSHHDLSP